MAEGRNEGTGFPVFLLAGIAVAVVVGLVAWASLGGEFGVPILILTAICGGVALFYRTLASQGSEKDPDQGGLPKLPADAGRPLGDTGEAHDEINPHDFPADSPGRKPAEAMASGDEGTTAGMSEGGAAGEGGSEGQQAVGGGESSEGARP